MLEAAVEDIAAETDSTAPWHGLTPVPTTCTNNLHCKATHDCIVLAKYRRKPVALVIVSWPPFLRPPTLGRAFEEYRRVYQASLVHMATARSPTAPYSTSDQQQKRPGAMRLQAQATVPAPGKTAVLLRSCSSASSAASGSSMMTNDTAQRDQPPAGSSKLVVQPDGNIVWEMPPDSPNGGGGGWSWGGELLRAGRAYGELTLLASGTCGTLLSLLVAMSEVDRAKQQNSCVTAHHLARLVAVTASSTAAGVAAGVVYAPLLAVRMLVGRAARPALLVGAALGAGRGLRALVGRLRASPARLLSALRALGAEGAALAGVLAQVAGRAARSEGFRKAFIRLGGMDTLLRLLTTGPDAAMLQQLLEALKHLVTDPAGQEALLAGGGVPQLVHCLTHPSPEVVDNAAQVLEVLAPQPAAAAAIRSCGGVPILLGLLRPSSPAPPATRVALLGVAGGLVAGDADPAGGCCAALVGGGLVEALVGLVGPQPLPRTQVKERALTLLHTLAAQDSAALGRLAAHPAAGALLAQAGREYGARWYPAKADLACLNELVGKATLGDAVMVDMGSL